MSGPPSMFEAHRPAVATSLANYIQPNLGHGLRIWWAFYWPTVFSQLLLTIGVNAVLRRYLEDPTLPPNTVRAMVLASQWDGYIFYYLIAFLMLGCLLRRNFRHFRIGLLSNRGGEGAQLLPPTLRRAARVWWTFSWRAVIYRLIATLAVTFPLGWTIGFLQAILPGQASAALVSLMVQVAIDGIIGMFVIYSSILDEDISDFRVALLQPRLPTTAVVAAASAPADLANT